MEVPLWPVSQKRQYLGL